MKEIVLSGSSDQKLRVDILSSLLTKAREKINHIDELRQRNLNYALIIFVGLFGIGMGVKNLEYKLFVSASIFLLMLIFASWDRRLHKINHGWRKTSSTLCQKICEIVNNPTQDISFRLYYKNGEKIAEWFGFLPVIFYALVLGSLISYFIFTFFPI